MSEEPRNGQYHLLVPLRYLIGQWMYVYVGTKVKVTKRGDTMPQWGRVVQLDLEEGAMKVDLWSAKGEEEPIRKEESDEYWFYQSQIEDVWDDSIISVEVEEVKEEDIVEV